MTPEQRYILATLVEDSDTRIRLTMGGYHLMACGAVGAGGRMYLVDRRDLEQLIAAGYLEWSPDAGGCPELTDAGRAAVAVA